MPLRHKRPDSLDDGPRVDAARAPPGTRNDAVRAVGVAAVLRLHHRPRSVLPAGHVEILLEIAEVLDVRRRTGQTSLDELEEPILIPVAHHERPIVRESVAHDAGVTSRGDHEGIGVEPLRLPEDLAGFPIGDVSHGAGIDDIDVGWTVKLDTRVTGSCELSRQKIGLALIDLAPQRGKGDGAATDDSAI